MPLMAFVWTFVFIFRKYITGFAGLGLSLLFWNGSSLGGVNILMLYLQKKYGWDPGKSTFLIDFGIVMTGVYTVGLLKGLYSILSVVVLKHY
jgi:uncharacterized membrane-anchored protein YitT (DUF2179 family)